MSDPRISPHSDPIAFSHFEKYHGAKNDFLFLRVPAKEHSSPQWSTVAKTVCERRTSFGADGLILWDCNGGTTEDLHVSMGIWNSDGTRASTCGNALRCLGLVLLRQELWSGKHAINVHAQNNNRAGPQVFARLESAELLESSASAVVKVHMGVLSEKTTLSLQAFSMLETELSPDWKLQGLAFIQLANPHVVALLERPNSPEDLDVQLQKLADAKAMKIKDILRFNGCLPIHHGDADVNLGLCVRDPSSLSRAHLIVHERGAGLTQACGSGAVAAAFMLDDSANQANPAGEKSVNHSVWSMVLPGGILMIDITGKESTMQGPANYVGRCLRN